MGDPAMVNTPIQFAAALSDADASDEAIEEATGSVLEQLGGAAIDLVVVFGTYHHRDHFEILAEKIQDLLAPRVALGLTAGGVIGTGQELEGRPGLSLLAAHLGGAELHPFSYGDLDPADPSNLERLCNQLGPDGPPKAVLMYADPFSTPMVKLIPAINDALPGVPFIGGMASGGAEAGTNRLILNDRVFNEGTVGVAVHGPVEVGCTVSQGCRPVGDPWIITKSRHNIIQEVGRRPVMEAIQETASKMPEQDQGLLQQGMFIGRVINEYKEGFGRGDFLIRNIIGADQDSGFIAVNDLVRVGQTIQFHIRDKATAEEDLRLLLENEKLHGPAAGAILCTCNGRGTNLYDEADTESRVIREALGNVPMAGFFAAGEIGPIGNQNFLHGLTASLAVFRKTPENAEA